jgi:hypothetical protein
MFEHSQPPTSSPTPTPTALTGGGDRLPDPAAALARKIVGQEEHAALGGRIRLALGGDDIRRASQCLGLDYHSVRRTIRGGRPSPEFLRRLCQAYNVDGHWLITGDGLMNPEARTSSALRSMPGEMLFAELSRRLARMLDGAENTTLEAAMRQSQRALDVLKAELPPPTQPPPPQPS